MLDYKEIENRVNQIKSTKTEEAMAHQLEDRLWREVLEAIASGQTTSIKEARRLADCALRTRKVDFFRWYTDGE